MENSWLVEHLDGSSQALHDTESDFSRRRIRVNRIQVPSLVLGSTQSRDLVDGPGAADRGIEIAQRRSGGGVVSMQPGAQCWVDVFIPADDPLWVDDVSLSALWLGEAWVKVAAAYGWPDAVVHRGAISRPDLSRLVCFAALGAGEVSHGRQKLVGISQRRTRLGAKFQCVAYLEWDPSSLLNLVELGSDAAEVEAALVHGVGELTSGQGPTKAHSPATSTALPAEEGRGVEWSVVERLVEYLP